MDKMPYYEPPYPEETHYSHVLRLARLNGFDRFMSFADNYLTFNGMTRHMDIRTSMVNMAPFFASTDIQIPYSDYILDTTAYAYHSTFLNEYRSRKHLNKFYKADDRLNYAVKTDKKLLHFCPECMKEGSYFRRVHQIPNVNICPIHGEPLMVCTNKKYHEYNGELNGEITNLTMSFDDEFQVASFINDMMQSDIGITLSDYRNVIYSKIGDASEYKDFAAKFMSSGLSPLFKDQKSVFNFITAGVRQGKIPEGEAVGILVFLFGTFGTFAEYYQQHKDDYISNSVDEGDFYDFIEKEGYSLESGFRQYIITVSHNDCGRSFVTSPSMLMDGWLCPHCHRNLDDVEFQRRIVDYSGHGEYTFIKPADGISGRITMHHTRCDSDITPTLDDFLFRGYKCKCNNKIIFSDAEKMVKEKGNFDLIKFTSKNDPVEIKCGVCGSIRKYADYSFAYNNSIECDICHPKKTLSKKEERRIMKVTHSDGVVVNYKNDINHARTMIYNLVGDEYSVLDFEKANNSGKYNVKVRHADCGKEYWTSFRGFLNGSRCQCEGLAVQASSDEFKRYIHDLSCGEYICVDDEITDRDHVHIQNIGNGEVKDLPYKMILQELKRITPSDILPCGNVNRNAVKPRSAPMLFMDYLRKAYGDDGVFFPRDFNYDASKAWISSTLNMMISQGLIKHIAWEIYTFADIEPDWEQITKLFYIQQNGIRHGCTYGRSFLQDLGIPVKHPPVRVHIMSNRDGRMTSMRNKKVSSIATVRIMGTVSLRFKKAPCEITEENYRILQVADYLGSHHNQNYPWLTDDEMRILAQYVKSVPAKVLQETLEYYPENVRDKVYSMWNEQ